jgi:hypothetical protein
MSAWLVRDSVVVQDREPIAAKVDNEIVMLSVRANAYFGLNGVGGEIWNMLTEPRSVGDICAKLTGDYDVEDETAFRQVCDFLQELLRRRLIRVVGREDSGA